MRITLVSPYGGEPPEPHLGLLYLAASLENVGHSVTIVDVTYLSFKAGKYLNSRTLCDIVEKTKPDAVGFTTISNNYSYALSLAKRVKDRLNVPIIFGGPQATHTAKQTVSAFKWIDFVVRGEGERTIVELVKSIEDGSSFENIPGIAFRRNGVTYQTVDRPFIEDIDDISFPAYHLVPKLKEYASLTSRPNRVVAPILSTRGCPFKCIFCSASTMWKRTPRFRSPSNILAEIMQLKKTQGINEVKFVDDTFTINKQRAKAICRLLRAEKIKWGCLSRIDTMDTRLLQQMKEAGCERIYYGLESGSPRIQKFIHKNLSLENALKIIGRTRQLGIECMVSFIIGFPGETLQDMELTRQFSEKVAATGAHCQGHVLVPLPGSEITRDYFDNTALFAHTSSMASLPPYWKLEDEFILEEERWVKKFPDIFSHYYSIRGGIDQHVLKIYEWTLCQWAMAGSPPEVS